MWILMRNECRRKQKKKKNLRLYSCLSHSLHLSTHIHDMVIYLLFVWQQKIFFFLFCFIFGKKKEWNEEVWLSCWAIKTRMENFRDLPDVWNWIFYIAKGVFISFFHFFHFYLSMNELRDDMGWWQIGFEYFYKSRILWDKIFENDDFLWILVVCEDFDLKFVNYSNQICGIQIIGIFKIFKFR